MLNSFLQFLKKNNGNVLTITALSLPILTTLSLGTIDYGIVLNKKLRLDDAANTAALSAVNEALIAYRTQENTDLKELIMASAEQSFIASAANISHIDPPNFETYVEIDQNVLSIKIDYSSKYNTQFAKFMGKDTINLAGSAEAKGAGNNFMNVSFLFDISASMGIGATTLDQIKVAQVNSNCAFACHLGGHASTTSYSLARNNGAVMRVDVARNSALNALDVIARNRFAENQITVGAHIFDNVLATISDHNDPRATDMSFVGRNIEDKVFMQRVGGGTNLNFALTQLAGQLPTSGMGRTADERRQVVIVFTDGVESNYGHYVDRWLTDSRAVINSPHLVWANPYAAYAMFTDVCTHVQNKNIELYFIYTEYLRPTHLHPKPEDIVRFDFIEGTLNPTITQRFAACAGGDEFVLKSTSAEEIEETFTELLTRVTAPLHLN